MFDLSVFRKPKAKIFMPEVLAELKQDKTALKKFTTLTDAGCSPREALYRMVYPNCKHICAYAECDTETDFNLTIGWGYRKFCSSRCVNLHNGQDKKVKRKREKTCLKIWGGHPMQNKGFQKKREDKYFKKHGVKNPGQNPDVQAKMRRTNLKRLGVDNAFKSEVVKDKIREGHLEKYGVPFSTQAEVVKAKIKRTNQKRYGVDNPSQSKEVQATRLATFIERFGGYPMHNAEIFAKCQNSSYRSWVVDIDGKSFNYRGYEGYVLQILNRQLGIPASNMSTKPTHQHKLWWTGKRKTAKDLTPKSTPHRYYPDIRIKHKGKDISIEVKSTYTVGLKDKNTFTVNKKKAQAAHDAGVDLRVWIVHPKTKRITRLENFHSMSWKELKEKFNGSVLCPRRL